MTSDHLFKKLVFRLLLACGIAVLAALYTGLIKSPSGRGFAVDLADILFLWGLTLLCVGLIYTTRFFGYVTYLRKLFGFVPFQRKNLNEAEEELDFAERQKDSSEPDKRDASLVYASLLLIVFSLVLSFI